MDRGLAILFTVVAARLRRGWIAERRRRAQEHITRQLLLSQEAERKRIAAELHDSLGQNLLVVKNRLYLAQQQVSGPATQQLRDISQVVSETLQEVREISYNLRPYLLDRIGLTKAIEGLVKKVADSGSLDLRSELVEVDRLLPPEGEINFYRIVQECLSNILKHSDAATARIAIARHPADLRAVGVDIVTLGQYLLTDTRHLPVARWWTPEEFDDLRRAGEAIGFAHVQSSPLTRSATTPVRRRVRRPVWSPSRLLTVVRS